jgi:hypothetical protein
LVDIVNLPIYYVTRFVNNPVFQLFRGGNFTQYCSPTNSILMDLEARRYPIGHFTSAPDLSRESIDNCIATIEAFPARLKAVVAGLSDDQLALQYRPDGWTIRQVVHHVVDSHTNSYVRFKWVLTEDHPTIKTYNQTLWAERPDAKVGPIEMSLTFLDGLHERWVYVLKTISVAEWSRTFYHPENERSFDLKWLVQMSDWHCRHHLAHVELALNSR